MEKTLLFQTIYQELEYFPRVLVDTLLDYCPLYEQSKKYVLTKNGVNINIQDDEKINVITQLFDGSLALG